MKRFLIIALIIVAVIALIYFGYKWYQKKNATNDDIDDATTPATSSGSENPTMEEILEANVDNPPTGQETTVTF